MRVDTSARPSAVFVAVPGAGALLAAAGIPRARRELQPHVTVLWPFLPARRLDRAALDRLAGALASRRAFRASFSTIGHFPGVVYLAPDDPAPFVALTEAVAAAWPEHPPYEGAYDEVVPHLTIGGGEVDERRLRDLLPLTADVDAVSVGVQRRFFGWRTVTRVPLSAS